MLKSCFFCTDQIANSARAREFLATRARARVVLTGSSFVDLSTFPMFLHPFQTLFLNLQSHREP